VVEQERPVSIKQAEADGMAPWGPLVTPVLPGLPKTRNVLACESISEA